jgi:glucoamylase
VQRYIVEKTNSEYAAWRFNNKRRDMLPGKVLRIVLLAPAMVHWTFNRWQTADDTETVDTGLGTYVIDLPTQRLLAGSQIDFTIFWRNEQRWEGVNFSVMVQNV